MNDYIKCCIANKFTLAGYLGGFISAVASSAHYIITKDYNTSFWIAYGGMLPSFIALGLTSSGLETCQEYKRTKKVIQKRGKLPNDFYRSGEYCSRKGVELALKEYDLEQLVLKENASNANP